MEDIATSVDYLFTADHVVVSEGKLFVNGGGWDRLTRVPGQPTNLGIALSLCIPWHETNQPLEAVIRLEDEDSKTLEEATLQFRVGRPSDLPQGSEQHLAMGIMVTTIFPAAGGYRITAEVNKKPNVKYWSFHVYDKKG